MSILKLLKENLNSTTLTEYEDPGENDKYDYFWLGGLHGNKGREVPENVKRQLGDLLNTQSISYTTPDGEHKKIYKYYGDMYSDTKPVGSSYKNAVDEVMRDAEQSTRDLGFGPDSDFRAARINAPVIKEFINNTEEMTPEIKKIIMDNAATIIFKLGTEHSLSRKGFAQVVEPYMKIPGFEQDIMDAAISSDQFGVIGALLDDNVIPDKDMIEDLNPNNRYHHKLPSKILYELVKAAGLDYNDFILKPEEKKGWFGRKKKNK